MSLPLSSTLTSGAGSTPLGQEWLNRLPQLVDRAVQRWGLTLQTPFPTGTAAWTAPGVTPDGTPVVLKIVYPHDEARFEAVALALWRGSVAVELLAHDADDWALLLRRANPGTPMLHSPSPPDELIDACLRLLTNLHLAPVEGSPVRPLRESCALWARTAAERARTWDHLLSDGRAVVARGVEQLAAFAVDEESPQALLHGDLNPGNVVLDNPGTPHWLAIDPKPMFGDPAYDIWPVLAQIDNPFGYADPIAVARPRLLRASRSIHRPPRTVALWCMARTVESILWQVDTWPTPDRQSNSLGALHEARVWAALADVV